MGWPGSTVSYSALDNGATDTPAQARPQLYAAVSALNTIISNGQPALLAGSISQQFGVATATGANNAPRLSQVQGLITAATGRLLAIELFTTGGTWTQPSGCNSVATLSQAGGAGGGSCSTTEPAMGGGGGGGARSYKYLTTGFGSSETVSVGAGGIGGASGVNNGTDGGDSSFGTLCVADGGKGGTAGDGSVGTNTLVDGAGGNGGTTSNCTGDIIDEGFCGGNGIIASGVFTMAGNGGAPACGGGARYDVAPNDMYDISGTNTYSADGKDAVTPGGGGQGAIGNYHNARSGGNGKKGWVLVASYS